MDLFFVFDCFVLCVLILVLFVFCLEVVFLLYLQSGMTWGQASLFLGLTLIFGMNPEFKVGSCPENKVPRVTYELRG